MHKTCTSCKQIKDISLFTPGKSRKGTVVYSSRCKDCRAELARNSRDKTAEKKCTCCGASYRVLGGGAKKKLDLCSVCYPTYRTAYSLYHSCLQRSKEKEIDFDLNINEIHKELIEGSCGKTGFKFEINVKGKHYGNRSPYSPSIDKIDPNKGYTKDNVQLVCWWYNLAKARYTDEEVLKLCRAVTTHNS